jgi:hypothetical protein
MAKVVLTAVVPTVLTAASGLAFWIYKTAASSSSASGGSQTEAGVLPPTASLATANADEVCV